jgi:antitoxin component of MazEF toxin-antitoxin module
MTTTTKIRAVGNLKGIIIPKAFLDQCGIEESVDITMKNNSITITASKVVVKKKWADFKPSGKKEKVKFIPGKLFEL